MIVVFGLSKKAASAARQKSIEMMADSISNDLENEPWFRNKMLWLVIAIPSLTVVGCMYTIYLALSHPDHLVHDAAVESQTSVIRDK